ncbi:MAG: hypothetical protein QOI80_1103 [Solirubrobacteraceae bacterium]|nr:hypothetical protein [Solirubrobacteraceae bacterium]
MTGRDRGRSFAAMTENATVTPPTGGVQGRLWGLRAADWARVQEAQTRPAFEAALGAADVGPGTRLLDVGCGAGLALEIAAARGAEVSGLDASPGMLAEASRRLPGASLVEGEIEALPYPDASFDVVTGFNSFQYAARPTIALREASRVAGPQGRVVLLNWAPAEQCDAGAYLMGLGRLMPPPPPGAPGPFALSSEAALRELFAAAGLIVRSIADVACEWRYPDLETAIVGLECSGPVQRVAEHAGEAAVREVTEEFLAEFRTETGGYALTNTFRYVIATPQPA